jgi:D-alanyl-D-alanine dipeptidase
MNHQRLASFIVLCLVLSMPGMGQFALPAKPYPIPSRWEALVGRYYSATDTILMREEKERLQLVKRGQEPVSLTEEDDSYRFAVKGGVMIDFRTDGAISFDWKGETYRRIEEGATFRISPLRPVPELQKIALTSSPPKERGTFVDPDLAELVTLDSTIKLDVRYASTENFLGAKVYSEPRAFLQRSAAEALVRAHQILSQFGYGVLVHDAYRPWYLTKIFWDATPEHLRDFVADPSKGSRHNRGCAVDLTLYDLTTGEVIEMPSGYDEFSERAYPYYDGGTSLQRWHRDLLRWAMEQVGFDVYEFEWWHFDFRGWEKYPIMNVTFENIR